MCFLWHLVLVAVVFYYPPRQATDCNPSILSPVYPSPPLPCAGHASRLLSGAREQLPGVCVRRGGAGEDHGGPVGRQEGRRHPPELAAAAPQGASLQARTAGLCAGRRAELPRVNLICAVNRQECCVLWRSRFFAGEFLCFYKEKRLCKNSEK